MLIGTNTDEHTLFLVPNGFADQFDEQRLLMTLGALGAPPVQAVATYRAARPGATPGELFVAAITDWFFRVPAVRLAEARSGDTYMYEFAWRSPAFDGRLGACHALELGFTFDNLDDPSIVGLAGPNPPQSVADEMHAAWVAFISGKDPGWAPYGDERVVRRFDTSSQTVQDPRPEERMALGAPMMVVGGGRSVVGGRRYGDHTGRPGNSVVSVRCSSCL